MWLLAEDAPASGVIFGYRLEYTHTPKEVLLYFHNSKEVGSRGVASYQPREKTGFFMDKNLPIKSHDVFLNKI